MIQCVFRPLLWSGPETPAARRRSQYAFKAGWSDTLALLERELRHLDASRIVVEADFRERDLRIDGWPRADARIPQHPGVRVAFESRHGPLVYATDSCAWWQHNVRSIALGLEALRAVDRYGVTRRGEQYAGWKAITAGAAPAGDPYEVLAEYSRHSRSHLQSAMSRDELRRACNGALRRSHPDVDGGSAEAFVAVQAAVGELKSRGVVAGG